MKTSLAAFAFVCANAISCLGQQGSIVANGQVYLYTSDSERQIIEDLMRQRQDIERLRQSDDARNYDYRNPTPEEIAAQVKAWNDANPYKLSTQMPDFSKGLVKTRKENHNSAERAANIAQAQELSAKISALEQQIAQIQATAKQEATRNEVTQTYRPPTQPNPKSVAMRKMPDGRTVAIVGGKMVNLPDSAGLDETVAGITAASKVDPHVLATVSNQTPREQVMGAQIENATQSSHNLRILSAFYGAENTFRDVTSYVQSAARNGRFRADNDTLGGDPISGKYKALKISYQFSGNTYEKTFAEGSEVRIP